MIQADVFPATVVLTGPDFPTPIEELSSRPPTPGAAPLDTARVVIHAERIMIATDSMQGPVLRFSEAIQPDSYHKGASDTDSYVTTVSGKRVVWRKDNQCGCGSRLRSWRPYKNMSSTKDPGPND